MATSTLSRFVCVPALWVLLLVVGPGPVVGESFKHRVTGLFMPVREADLRTLVDTIPDLTVVDVDFKTAVVTFDYDPKKLGAGGNPEQHRERLHQLLRAASRNTFGIRLSDPPTVELTLIAIPVAGCHCKACSFAAYESIYNLDGVERATASFREGQVTVLINPKVTDRSKVETALKKKGVKIETE